MRRTLITITFLILLLLTFTVKPKASQTIMEYNYTDITGIGFTINVATASEPQDVNMGASILDLDYLNSLSLLRMNSNYSRDEQNTFNNLNDFCNQTKREYSGYFTGAGLVGGFYGEISTGLSGAVGTNMRNCYNQYFGIKKYSSGLYELALPNYSSFLTYYSDHFSLGYYNAIRDLYNSTNRNYDAFFDTYGTHMIAQAVYGCRLSAYFVAVSSERYFDRTTVSELQTNLNAIYSNFTAGGTLRMEDMEYTSLDTNNSIMGSYIMTYGGNSNYGYTLSNGTGGSMFEWYSSTNENNAVIIGYKNGLIPLWEILPYEFSSLAEELERAYEDYIRYYSTDLFNDFSYRGKVYAENTVYNYNSYDYNGNVKPYRSQEYVIKDTGRFNQSFDEVNLNNFGIIVSDCIAQGFTKMYIELQFDVAEKNDGYRYVFLYQKEKKAADNILLFTEQFDYENLQTDYINRKIEINSIDLINIIDNKFFIRYGASGTGNDTWYNKNLMIKIKLIRN